MKENKIVCGTKDELVEYFYNIVKPTQDICAKKDNYLYSKEGIEKQITDVLNDQKGVGMIFYMTMDTDVKPIIEVNIKLMSSYIHVKDK
jgi:hypothetical protein